eukprot:4611709-Prymnesium_polylepis.1
MQQRLSEKKASHAGAMAQAQEALTVLEQFEAMDAKESSPPTGGSARPRRPLQDKKAQKESPMTGARQLRTLPELHEQRQQS